MAIPNLKLTPNNVSTSSDIMGKSSTFLDSYIYAKNSRYNALYEKNKEILQIENYGITMKKAEYLYDAFMEHVRVLDTVVTRMRNFSFKIKSDVISNLYSIIPDNDDLIKFEDAISSTPDIPNFKYIHYDIQSINYANMTILESMFTQELKGLSTSSEKVAGGSDSMQINRSTKFLTDIMKNYKTTYDGLLDMEELKVMTSSRRNTILNFYKRKGKIISSVNKDFKTYHFFLRQFSSISKMSEKLEPQTLDDGKVLVNGSKILFTDYVVIYKHFSTMMKYILDIVSLYDNLFYNKIYALQSNIEVYNSIIKYSIEFYNAKKSGDQLNESTLIEAWWDGYLNSGDIDAHNMINGNSAAQELLWDNASEIDDEEDEFLSEIDEPLEEGATLEKISSSVKDKYLAILSYIKDIYRKWQGIESIELSSEEESLLKKIESSSRELISDLLEILRTGKPISYESKYDDFLDTINKFKKAHKNNKEKDKSISINTLHDQVKKLESALHESTKSKVEFATKYRTALWVVISRSLYVVNVLLYNASGKGQGKANKGIKKQGIESKRFGKNALNGMGLQKLDKSDITPLLNKLRNASSYTEYKKVFDEVCEIYKKDNMSALKLLDLTKHNKLVFVGYNKLKPMILKAGTKLYHISPCATFTHLEPRFKSKDNITFYAKPRIYFTDKFVDPKKVLPNVSNPNIYEYTVPHDIEAYRDSEYGSWYHNCIYIETDKNAPIKNVTDEFIKTDDKKEMSESITWKKYYDLDILNESIASDIDDVKKSLDKDDKHTLGCTESELEKVKNNFNKLSDENKKKKLPIILSIIKKVMNTISYMLGIGFIKDSVTAYKNDKEFMHDIKTEMPMNHETYNKIYSAIFFKSILRIIFSILVTIASTTFILVGLSKSNISELKEISNKANTISSKAPSLKSVCDNIIKTISKILPFGILESCEYIDIYDGDKDIDISDDKIDGIDIDMIDEDAAWLQDTGEEVGPICTVRSSIVS